MSVMDINPSTTPEPTTPAADSTPPETPPAAPANPAEVQPQAAPAPTPPAEPAAAAAPAPAAEPPKTDSKHPKRILLVEDDDALANVYISRLQAEGFDVRRVSNGEEALSTAINYKPDLIVLDVMMPKVSGFDVLDILRNTPETANLKIIMLTALGQPSDQDRAKALGADDYLVKSQVVIADVIDRIRHHLGA